MAQAKIDMVNKILQENEPGNISVDEHSGYTGYTPQCVIDAMNEALWGEWGFTEISNEIVPGDKGGLAVAKVSVWLKDITFEPTAWGQNRVTRGDVGDAHKGAQTDAIKKALSYFSIGNRAYLGLLPNKQEQANAARSQRSQSRPQSTTEKPVTPTPDNDSPVTREQLTEIGELAKAKQIQVKRPANYGIANQLIADLKSA